MGNDPAIPETIEVALPLWDVPRQNQTIDDYQKQGWELVNVSDRKCPARRVLTFRKKATP